MQVKHEIKVTGVGGKTSYGSLLDKTFDVFVFDDERDYNCYIERSTMWLQYGEVQGCDFVGKEGAVFEMVDEWSSSDPVFLSKHKVHNDVFVVLDNTGWLH